jgi:methionyl-tRNA formyltransferase
MKFKKIEKFYLFGSGENMHFFADKIKKKLNVKIYIFMFTGHKNEKYKNFNLVDYYKKLKINFRYINDPNTYLSKKKINNSIAICFGSKWIYKDFIIKKFEHGIYNINPIPFPNYMGGAHFTWQILNSDFNGGIYFQQITNKLDRGTILDKKKIAIKKDSKYPEDYFKIYNPQIKKFLVKILRKIEEKKEFSKVGSIDLFSRRIYFPRLNTNINGYINWDWNIDEIVRFCRAFSYPYSGAKTFHNNKIVSIQEIEIYKRKKFHPFCNGIIIRKNLDKIYVSHRSGILLIKKILDKKNEIINWEFKQGDRIYTKKSALEKSYTYRQNPS